MNECRFCHELITQRMHGPTDWMWVHMATGLQPCRPYEVYEPDLGELEIAEPA